jgi:AAA15 family ATPase/GTPase
MIISFSVENFLSFQDKVTISTVASKQRRHKERVPRIGKYKLSVLPVAAIYGGNASGKSNFCEAILFARRMVVAGRDIDRKIPVKPFLLRPEAEKQPSKFWIELLTADDYIYEYYFSVTQDMVCEERLTKVKAKTEQLLFERNDKKINIYDKRKKSQLDFIGKNTRGNQLFLTNTIEQNNDNYEEVYSWFRYGLKVITPTARYANLKELIDQKKPTYSEVNKIFQELDTGIDSLGDEEVKDKNLKDVGNRKQYLRILENISGDRFVEYPKKGEDTIRRLVTYHKRQDGKKTRFDFSQESDGTRRLVELIPAFLKRGPEAFAVFVIDEIDRSLHHLLIKRLLERYLESCDMDTRLQIIFTTHDLLLMSQELFRRDEMFIVERNDLGASSIIPLNEYRNIRIDKDILKSYLYGRFGGIPKI